MVWTPPKQVTVGIDNREKNPLLFPQTIEWMPARGWKPSTIVVKTKVHKFDTGDYRLEKFPNTCVIERKGGTRELHNNLCTGDFLRCSKAFERLSTAEFPVLMLDCGIAEFWNASSWRNGNYTVNVNPGLVWDRLIQESHKYGFELWLAGRAATTAARRRLGEAALRLMLYYAYGAERGSSPATIVG